MTDEPLTLDGADADAMEDRSARLRAELGRLDMARDAARADALADLTAAAAAARKADAALADRVAEARGFGATWQQIADAVGIARQSAWARWAEGGGS